MIKLDSIRLNINDMSTIKTIDESCFELDTKTSQETGQVLKDRLILSDSYRQVGLKSVIIDKLNKQLLIEISAKILKGDYFNLINENSIESAIDNISNNAIDLNVNKIIDTAEVLRCDVTNNLPVEKPVKSYINIMNTQRFNYKYDVRKYDYQGVVFRNTAKSYKERVVFYDKSIEIKKDKELLKHLTEKQVKQFDNILRVEQNLTSKKRLRLAFQLKRQDKRPVKKNNIVELIPDNRQMLQKAPITYLKDILVTDTNPNYDLFNKISDRQITIIFDRLSDESLHNTEKFLGRKYTLMLFKYDMNLIRQYLKTKVKANISKYMKKYEQVLNEINKQREKQHQQGQYEQLLREIRELLKVS